MNQLIATKMTVDGTRMILEVTEQGEVTVDLADWEKLIKDIDGIPNIKKAKLLGDMIEFPNNVHVEIEDLVTLAEKQKNLKVSASLLKVLSKIVK
jgi:ethanolamine utilization cobalamin adenosyltransferase